MSLQLKYLKKRSLQAFSFVCAPLHSNNKTSKKNGTPHNLVRQLLLTLFYDRPYMKIGQEKKYVNRLFCGYRHPGEYKIDIKFLEISMNIPINGLSTYNKRFLLFRSITIAFRLFGNRRQELKS